MTDITIQDLNQKFITACESGDLEQVKTLYLKSSDKQIPKLKFFKQEPVFDPHYDDEQALRRANYQERKDIVQFLLSDNDFTDKMNKKWLTSFLSDAISGRVLKGSKNLELTMIIVPLLTKYEIPCTNNIIRAFKETCVDGSMDILEYLAENFDIYSKLPALISSKPYSLKEYGFIAGCESGNLDVVKFFLNSPKLKSKIDINNIVTKVQITNKEIVNYLIFDFNIPRDNFFAQHIIGDNSDRILEKRDIYNNLNSELSTHESPQSKSKIKL